MKVQGGASRQRKRGSGETLQSHFDSARVSWVWGIVKGEHGGRCFLW